MESYGFDLTYYVKQFHEDKKAGLITNARGAILEVNEAVAQLMSVDDSASLVSKLLVSYVHRKHVREFQEFIRKVISSNSGECNTIWLRPRGCLPFQASIEAHVVMRSKALVIIRWNIVNTNTQVISRDETPKLFKVG